jgi:hypothetical protein
LNDPPRQGSLFSPRRMMGRSRNGEGEEFDPLNLLISIGTVLTLALILLLVMQFADINPVFRFGLLLLAMSIAALVLVRRSYVGKDRRLSSVTEGSKKVKAKNGLQLTVENLDLAFEGDPYWQMLAFQELRDLLIERLALRKRVPRSLVIEMASDRFWLEEEVEQADLRMLLSADIRESSLSERSAFPNQYRRYLDLVEEL